MSCQSVTFNNICFDAEPITCSQAYRTVAGTFCNGNVAFSTTAASYSCNVNTVRSAVSTLGCNLQPLSFQCYGTNTKSYSTATLTRVAYVTSSGCYSPLSEVHTYFEVITFKEGNVNGISATVSVDPNASNVSKPTTSPRGGVLASPTLRDDEPIVQTVQNATNNLTLIIGIAAGVVVVIVAVIAFIILRKNSNKKRFANGGVNPAQQQPFPQQPYQQPYQQPIQISAPAQYPAMIPPTVNPLMSPSAIPHTFGTPVKSYEKSFPIPATFNPKNEDNAFIPASSIPSATSDGSNGTAVMYSPGIPSMRPL
ncbi:hypothetical protein HK098_002054 [Nowakowskiella sp. JEL0407]|nr:hypothetical protein HK098_002054 [Nowakowskiella sp. JEL0407]